MNPLLNIALGQVGKYIFNKARTGELSQTFHDIGEGARSTLRNPDWVSTQVPGSQGGAGLVLIQGVAYVFERGFDLVHFGQKRWNRYQGKAEISLSREQLLRVRDIALAICGSDPTTPSSMPAQLGKHPQMDEVVFVWADSVRELEWLTTGAQGARNLAEQNEAATVGYRPVTAHRADRVFTDAIIAHQLPPGPAGLALERVIVDFRISSKRK